MVSHNAMDPKILKLYTLSRLKALQNPTLFSGTYYSTVNQIRDCPTPLGYTLVSSSLLDWIVPFHFTNLLFPPLFFCILVTKWQDNNQMWGGFGRVCKTGVSVSLGP